MSQALKHRTFGRFKQSISCLKEAIAISKIPSQTVFAKLMLGDCLVEAKKYSQARKVFNDLKKTANQKEERAEATFRLAQVESQLGNSARSIKLCKEVIKKYKHSPYADLARSFIGVENASIEEDKVEKEVAKIAYKPKVINKKIVAKSVTKPVAKSVTKAEPKKIKEVKPVIEPKLKKSAKKESKPIKVTIKKTEPQEKPVEKSIKKAHVSKPKIVNKPKYKKSKGKKLDAQTAQILKTALTINSGSSSGDLVTKILSDQNLLKDGVKTAGMDAVLYRLASNTAVFGEHLEACKIYDQILTHHPTSPKVEEAYYEAIRLRAILKVYDAVIPWSKAFLAAFPTSGYRKNIKALILYAEAKGMVNLSAASAMDKKFW